MALVKGTNSYATVAEADSYFRDRLDAQTWASSDSALKAQALITATAILDDQRWIGTVSSETQSLSFPRIGEYFDPRLGINKSMDPIPERILKAVFEQALHLLTNEGLLDETGSVIDLQIASISLTRVKSPEKISQSVKRFISPLLINGGSQSWWRAN